MEAPARARCTYVVLVPIDSVPAHPLIVIGQAFVPRRPPWSNRQAAEPGAR